MDGMGKAISKFLRPNAHGQDFGGITVPAIIVLGSPGSGKSTFINTVTQSNNLEICHDLNGGSQQGPTYVWDNEHSRVYVDTPGIQRDTNFAEFMLSIRDYLVRTVAPELVKLMRKPVSFSTYATIYVHRFTTTRLPHRPEDYRAIINRLFGPQSSKRFRILCTNWERVQEDARLNKIELICRSFGVEKEKVHCCQGTYPDACVFIDDLLKEGRTEGT
ncbi:hypothetical protein M422DRAFT_67853 [Sphaerobolus stellatus SS14]|uniref:G domain-containing protein n=1 Tax=Sphaerobolus stellatus (strain SS14) TaxID=990650 RepID=A0A0C9VNG6_SPHS4|nr:hypothetical protein M422DRAFT_67853 [Sphaerobolus stellatus SS14]